MNAVSAASSGPAARSWQVCQLRVQVQHIDATLRQMRAVVQRIQQARPASAECPAVGTQLQFRPGTLDYQSELPRRWWPAVGQQVALTYRYLDGQCKDRGPCRITHYGMVR